MYSFVVLGQIPGTGITISFTMWLGLCLAAIAVTIWLRARHQNPQPNKQQERIEALSSIAI